MSSGPSNQAGGFSLCFLSTTTLKTGKGRHYDETGIS